MMMMQSDGVQRNTQAAATMQAAAAAAASHSSSSSQSIEEFCNQIAQLRNEYEDTILKVKTANKAKHLLQEESAKLEQELQTATLEIANLTRNLAAQAHKLADAHVECQVKQTQLAQVKDKHAHMTVELQKLSQQVDEEQVRATLEIQQFNKRIQELINSKQQMSTMSSTCATLKAEVEAKIADLEDRHQLIKQLHYQQSENEQAVIEKQVGLDKKSQEIEDLERELQELKQQVGTITLSIQTEKRRASKVQGNGSKPKSEEDDEGIKTLAHEVEQLKAQEKQVEFQHSRILSSIAKHEQDIQSAQEKINSVTEEMYDDGTTYNQEETTQVQAKNEQNTRPNNGVQFQSMFSPVVARKKPVPQALQPAKKGVAAKTQATAGSQKPQPQPKLAPTSAVYKYFQNNQ